MNTYGVQVSKSLSSIVVTSRSGAVIRADKSGKVIYSSIGSDTQEYKCMSISLILAK